MLTLFMKGLAPTMIIVRVAYGKSIDSVQQMMSIRFVEGESQRPGTPQGGLRGTVVIPSRTQANEPLELESDVEVGRLREKKSLAT